jgi:asparagine synthase (glutamine-hydrolysing)
MCGIAGILRREPDRPIEPTVLDRMTDVLAHRGPDGRGTHIDGRVGLGHRRLSIIDLSAEAAQPLANEDRSVWVVFNGEIYNFRDLRHELEGKGHVFRSRTDSEVLVHLYEEAGPRMVERLRGMFAFGLWDARRQTLLLARDRFGQKPLYYQATARTLRFASEIKGILEDSEVAREPDLEALDQYLTYGYVPAPRTAFAGIHKLPPGHRLIAPADGAPRVERYWQLRTSPKRSGVSPGERTRAAQRVLELLDEATHLRLISDVPLGAFLSGGIDSSAIVAAMCAGTATRPRTFCIGFEHQGFDESAYAQQVADHVGSDHRMLRLTPEAVAPLEHLAWHYGEPFGDSSSLPTYALSALARRHVTVALTGDGGDELFAGYRRYLATEREAGLRRAAAPLRALARSRVTIALLRRARRKALAKELEHDRRNLDLSEVDLYLSRVETIGPELKAALYSDGCAARARTWDARDLVRQAIARSDGETLAEKCAHADVTSYLADDILTKVDVASMAHGLECRAPLLDHVLAEFVASLPFTFKIDRGRRKAVLKDAVRGRLPRTTLERRKRGFQVPLAAWLQGSLEPLLRETLLSSRARERGYFDPPSVEALIDQHAAGQVNHQTALYCLLMHELWHRQWIDAGAQSPTRP